MKDSETEIQQCVERLCQEGCDRVYEYIDDLRAGRQPPGTGLLTPVGRRAVLEELQSIMSVYESSSR